MLISRIHLLCQQSRVFFFLFAHPASAEFLWKQQPLASTLIGLGFGLGLGFGGFSRLAACYFPNFQHVCFRFLRHFFFFFGDTP